MQICICICIYIVTASRQAKDYGVNKMFVDTPAATDIRDPFDNYVILFALAGIYKNNKFYINGTIIRIT